MQREYQKIKVQSEKEARARDPLYQHQQVMDVLQQNLQTQQQILQHMSRKRKRGL